MNVQPVCKITWDGRSYVCDPGSAWREVRDRYDDGQGNEVVRLSSYMNIEFTTSEMEAESILGPAVLNLLHVLVEMPPYLMTAYVTHVERVAPLFDTAGNIVRAPWLKFTVRTIEQMLIDPCPFEEKL